MNPSDLGTATMDDFERLDLRVGRIIAVDAFPQARTPAFKLTIDFGPMGTRGSSAQVTHYEAGELVGRDVVCVLGFPPKRIAGFVSEVLVLGAVPDGHGVSLLRPDAAVPPGTQIA